METGSRYVTALLPLGRTLPYMAVATGIPLGVAVAIRVDTRSDRELTTGEGF